MARTTSEIVQNAVEAARKAGRIIQGSDGKERIRISKSDLQMVTKMACREAADEAAREAQERKKAALLANLSPEERRKAAERESNARMTAARTAALANGGPGSDVAGEVQKIFTGKALPNERARKAALNPTANQLIREAAAMVTPIKSRPATKAEIDEFRSPFPGAGQVDSIMATMKANRAVPDRKPSS